MDSIKSWTWNDPISLIYKELFNSDIIYDLKINEDEIRNDLRRRYLHKIPPGYKDKSKPDDGIGDLLIWLTILEFAKKKKDVVFVTGEEKSDWFYKSENQILYPRFELLEEFRKHSDKKSFHIIKLFELLNFFDADDKAIKELELEDSISSTKLKLSNILQIQKTFETAVSEWFVANNEVLTFIKPRNSFPDLIAEDFDNRNTGIEILQMDSIGINNKFKEGLIMANDGFMEGKYENFMFVFVGNNSKSIKFEPLVKIINMFRGLYNDINYKYVFGYLDEKNNFIEIRNL